MVSRTIGGHVFWPAHQVEKKPTINQARRWVCERFDITLAELQNYLSNAKNALYHKGLYDTFKRYETFFEDYFQKRFDNYINALNLSMFICDNKVISLVKSDIENKHIEFMDKKDKLGFENDTSFRKYIKNSIYLIENRTKIFEDILGRQSPTS